MKRNYEEMFKFIKKSHDGIEKSKKTRKEIEVRERTPPKPNRRTNRDIDDTEYVRSIDLRFQLAISGFDYSLEDFARNVICNRNFAIEKLEISIDRGESSWLVYKENTDGNFYYRHDINGGLISQEIEAPVYQQFVLLQSILYEDNLLDFLSNENIYELLIYSGKLGNDLGETIQKKLKYISFDSQIFNYIENVTFVFPELMFIGYRTALNASTLNFGKPKIIKYIKKLFWISMAKDNHSLEKYNIFEHIYELSEKTSSKIDNENKYFKGKTLYYCCCLLLFLSTGFRLRDVKGAEKCASDLGAWSEKLARIMNKYKEDAQDFRNSYLLIEHIKSKASSHIDIHEAINL
eukprot:NODE_546_length_6213_cov_1.440301.p3 type:complete len:349 gc:universal NODE_546_length_6213_cov_1.440301:1222-176(-)